MSVHVVTPTKVGEIVPVVSFDFGRCRSRFGRVLASGEGCKTDQQQKQKREISSGEPFGKGVRNKESDGLAATLAGADADRVFDG